MTRPSAGERECAQSAFWIRLLIWASRHARDDLDPRHSRKSANPAVPGPAR